MTLGFAISQKRSQPTNRVVGGESIPAPVAGWNKRDPLFNMDPRFATILDNYFPQTNFVELRKGHTSHATGVGSSAVETVFSYRSGSTKKLLASGGGGIYDATASGAVGAPLASGFGSNRWQTTNFNSRGILVNGTDAPQSYDGSTISAAGFTGSGLTPSDLFAVHPFKERLLFLENNSASFWFGGVDAVTGSLSEFPLASVHPEGGRAVAINTLTIDGGSGIDDLLCIFMESGDVLIYAGTDPSSASTFALIGIFSIGKPVGSRPLVKLGPDLIVITSDGYIPLRQFLRVARSQTNLAISDTISGAVSDAVRTFGANFGWQAVLYPRSNWLLFNVPKVEGGQADQHVMNTLTGAWCRFTGMDAVSWTNHEERLYFGGTGGVVFLADDTAADAGSSIIGDAQTAYVYFGGRARLKRFTNFRPILSSDATVEVSMGLGVDFQDAVGVNAVQSVATAGTLWNTELWDTFLWAGGGTIQKNWQTAADIGTAAAVRVKTETNNQSVQWFSTDVLFEPGGFI
ncbi:MAG: hypothetical protein ACR2RF_26360 [Geminicoccaceae bacterium]